MRSARRLLFLIAVVVLLAVACTATAPPSAGPPARSTSAADPPVTTPRTSPIHTVFLVMMENADWSAVRGSTSWPYLNGLLAVAAHAENYRSGLHPSLPNYVELEAGETFGETDGSYLPVDHPIHSSAHLTTQLRAAHVDWKYWAEDLPGNGSVCNTRDPGTPYSLDHDAQVYFDDVRADPAYCIAHERPYAELGEALRKGTATGYNLIVPNDYDQGEKLAPGSSDRSRQADAWLSREIPRLQASQAYGGGALILILWDESAGADRNPSGLVALGRYVKAGHASEVAYSHGSTLRTLQEIFATGPLLGDAAKSPDLSDLLTVALG